jgi:putative heme utilization carrier protein HutX
MELTLTLAEFMQRNPDEVLEDVAQNYGATLLAVVRHIPGHVVVSGSQFDAIWNAVINWGSVTTLVNTDDVILEYSGPLPAGSYQRGYFNFRSQGGLSGHIKEKNCDFIGLFERKFMGLDTASIVFFNGVEQAMLKIFLGRDEKRNLLADQVVLFRSLQVSLKAIRI